MSTSDRHHSSRQLSRPLCVLLSITWLLPPAYAGQTDVPATEQRPAEQRLAEPRVVQPGDTLMTIARQHWESLVATGAPVTLAQVLVAVYRTNSQAFGRDMNDLLVGSTLQWPAADVVQQIPRREALQEVRAALGIWGAPATPEASAPLTAPSTLPPTLSPPTVAAALPTLEERLARLEAELEANQQRLDAIARQPPPLPQATGGWSSVAMLASRTGPWWWLLLPAIAVLVALRWRRRRVALETTISEESPAPTALPRWVPPPATSINAVTDVAGMPNTTADEGDPPPLLDVRSLIDLARAYIEMGEHAAARAELQRALELGEEAERDEARRLLGTLPGA